MMETRREEMREELHIAAGCNASRSYGFGPGNSIIAIITSIKIIACTG
ncbi:MAG TPA: hypothetical protein VI756_23095 [Blastocatellia bacterium]